MGSLKGLAALALGGSLVIRRKKKKIKWFGKKIKWFGVKPPCGFS